MSLGNAHADTTLRILVLGGTAEARGLAQALTATGYPVVTSLAGRTKHPAPLAGTVRVGGFGGAEGLARHLAADGIDALIDATHPFAARISTHAVAAAEVAEVPLLRLTRGPWPDRLQWLTVDTLAAAAVALPEGARVLLTIGRQELDSFFARNNCTFVARLIEPRADLPSGWTTISARGPFTKASETALLETHGITHLVSKNSGAEAVAAKLDAADALGVRVVMVSRPALPPAREVETIAEALSWVAAQAGRPKLSSTKSGPA